MRLTGDLLAVRDLHRRRLVGRVVIAVSALATLVAVVHGERLGLSSGAADGLAPLALLAVTSIVLALRLGAPVTGGRRGPARGRFATDGDAIELDLTGHTPQRLPFAEVASGWFEPSEDGEVAVLLTRGGAQITATVDAPQRAGDLLREVGVAAQQRALVLRPSPAHGPFLGALLRFCAVPLAAIFAFCLALLVILIIVVFTGSGGETALAMLAAVILAVMTTAVGGTLTFLVRPLLPVTLHIGTDGVLVRRSFGSRLLRRDEIARVFVDDGDVVIRSSRGRGERIATSPGAAAALAARIQAAIAASHAPTEAEAILDRLDRRGRPFAAWMAELRALATGPAGYREAALGTRELCAVAQDASAPVERRVAAAVALSAHEGDEVPAGLRAAVESTVARPLRIAMEKAAAGALEEAELEAAEAEARQATRPT